MEMHEIEAYLESLVTFPHPLLKELTDRGKAMNFPIVGPVVGQFLYQLARVCRPKVVFELGSGFGYSALWVALGMETGEIYLTDKDPRLLAMAQENFQKSGVQVRASFLHGDALQAFEEWEGEPDWVVLDIEKERYPQAFDRIVPRLKPGGFLIADNLFWLGKVFNPRQVDPSTEGIREFTRKIMSDPRVMSTIFPLRDGVSVSVKVAE